MCTLVNLNEKIWPLQNLVIVSNVFQGSKRGILSVSFETSEIRVLIPVFFLGYFLSAIFAPFFSPEKSHRRDVPPRKLNSSDEPRRAGVIEKTSREIGKAFLSSVRFSMPAVNSA